MRAGTFLTKRERKELMRKNFESLLKNNRYLIVVDAKGLKTKLLTEVRRQADDYGYIVKGGKNGVLIKAIEHVNPRLTNLFKQYINGQNIFIFTNVNPIEIALKLSELEVSLPISPGEIAPEDIIVPEGNTGIPPGPIISLFSSLNIPTRIISGTIHIMKDTTVIKAGERASMEAASILQKLGIYPIKSRLKFKFAIDLIDGTVIKAEDLIPNIDELINVISESVKKALSLAIGIAYPHEYVIKHLLVKATISAYTLSMEVGYITDKTLPNLISIAIIRARKLSEYVGNY